MGNNNFFAFVSRMKFINRWALMRNTQNENLMEHSLQVAMFAHALAELHNVEFCEYESEQVDANKIAVLAIYHDSCETITGDMPTPIKYFSDEISAAYKSIEEIANTKLLNMLGSDLKDKYKGILFEQPEDEKLWGFVKAADKLSAYAKCVVEINSGNKEFVKAKKSIEKKIFELEMPVAQLFMEKYMPAFERSLDEM